MVLVLSVDMARLKKPLLECDLFLYAMVLFVSLLLVLLVLVALVCELLLLRYDENVLCCDDCCDCCCGADCVERGVLSFEPGCALYDVLLLLNAWVYLLAVVLTVAVCTGIGVLSRLV